jgi:hypothetical protein
MEKAFLIDSSDGGADRVITMLFSVVMDITAKDGSSNALHDSIAAANKHALKAL